MDLQAEVASIRDGSLARQEVRASLRSGGAHGTSETVAGPDTDVKQGDLAVPGRAARCTCRLYDDAVRSCLEVVKRCLLQKG